MHYLEDISAGKLLVLEHGRREGVDGGPDVVVEKEDEREKARKVFKNHKEGERIDRGYKSVDFQDDKLVRMLLWNRWQVPKTQDSTLRCRSTSKACYSKDLKIF